MAERQDFVIGGKGDAMLADDSAAAHDGKANFTLRPRAGDAVTGASRGIGQGNPAPPRRRFTEHQGRAGRGVDLVPMMRLEDLDVVGLWPQGSRRLLDKTHQHVQSQGEIAGADDRDTARRVSYGADLTVIEAGGSEQQPGPASFRADLRQGHGRRGRGEIDHHVGPAERRVTVHQSVA